MSSWIPLNKLTCYDSLIREFHMAETNIEWTDVTWNPVAGCSIISKGCSNCYAMRMAARLEAMGTKKYLGLTKKTKTQPVWTDRIYCDESALEIPLRWGKSKKVFVNSMSDLFHEAVPKEFVLKVWNVMKETPQHIYQILTKRPKRMNEILRGSEFSPLKNVWLGTSVEDSEVLHRLDSLRVVPGYIRFVSFEPLIGSVAGANLEKIHWAIVGGESGPRARPMNSDWVDEIAEACDESGTVFFFKQWGGKNKKATGRVYKGRTWDDFPELRI